MKRKYRRRKRNPGGVGGFFTGALITGATVFVGSKIETSAQSSCAAKAIAANQSAASCGMPLSMGLLVLGGSGVVSYLIGGESALMGSAVVIGLFLLGGMALSGLS